MMIDGCSDLTTFKKLSNLAVRGYIACFAATKCNSNTGIINAGADGFSFGKMTTRDLLGMQGSVSV